MIHDWYLSFLDHLASTPLSVFREFPTTWPWREAEPIFHYKNPESRLDHSMGTQPWLGRSDAPTWNSKSGSSGLWVQGGYRVLWHGISSSGNFQSPGVAAAAVAMARSASSSAGSGVETWCSTLSSSNGGIFKKLSLKSDPGVILASNPTVPALFTLLTFQVWFFSLPESSVTYPESFR